MIEQYDGGRDAQYAQYFPHDKPGSHDKGRQNHRVLIISKKQLPQDENLRINRQKRSTETAIIERRTTMEEKKTMSEDKKIEKTSSELNDEALDRVSGGVQAGLIT